MPYKLTNDIVLLRMMLAEMEHQSALYQPGPYWQNKTKNSTNEIYRCGLENFRSSSSQIGLSFADNLFFDIRDTWNNGFKKIAKNATNAFPLKKLFDPQVMWTKSYAEKTISLSRQIVRLTPRVKHLLSKYHMPYTLLGSPDMTANINEEDISIHYINLLDQHDHCTEHIRFDAARSVFEIGGGFGVNIHLLLENYKNIKKVLYLDIPPNLYVGTQYLKAFYGDAVYDYSMLKDCQEIKFSENDSREIFCIAPWQIEKFTSSIDIFMNSHSFVEMPKEIVKNYVNHFQKLPAAEDSAVVLISYDNFDVKTTLPPSDLPGFFDNRIFVYKKGGSILDSEHNNIFNISAAGFAVPQSNN